MIAFKIWFSVLAFILGSSLGSFARLVAYRVSNGLSIIEPKSHCPECKKILKPYDNIPIISWIILGGKCRICKASIGLFSLLIEISGGIVFMLAYLQYGNSFEDLPIFVALNVLVFLFLIIAAIDYETHNIYNISIIIYAVISIFIFTYRVMFFDINPWSNIVGAIFGFTFFGTVKLVSKIVLKKDALGAGDVYLVGIGGLMIGFFPLLISIIIATLLALIIEQIMIKSKEEKGSIEIAFAPYLLLGIAIMSIYGEMFVEYYWEVIMNVVT